MSYLNLKSSLRSNSQGIHSKNRVKLKITILIKLIIYCNKGSYKKYKNFIFDIYPKILSGYDIITLRIVITVPHNYFFIMPPFFTLGLEWFQQQIQPSLRLEVLIIVFSIILGLEYQQKIPPSWSAELLIILLLAWDNHPLYKIINC